MTGSVTVHIKDMPEVLAGLRLEMAKIVREEAAAEPSGYVRERLERIAAAFESGQHCG